MPTLDQIKQTVAQVNPIQEKRLLKMKEIPELVNFLHTDEQILRITPALVKHKHDVYPGIFSATNSRCFFLYKGGLITKIITEQFPYEKISSVEYKAGVLSADLIIYATGNSIKLENIAKEEVNDICEFLNQHSHQSVSTQTDFSPSANDVISQLERLAALKHQGALSEEEFEFSKKKLLGI